VFTALGVVASIASYKRVKVEGGHGGGSGSGRKHSGSSGECSLQLWFFEMVDEPRTDVKFLTGFVLLVVCCLGRW